MSDRDDKWQILVDQWRDRALAAEDRLAALEAEVARLLASFDKIACLTALMPHETDDGMADLVNDWLHIHAIAVDPLGKAALTPPSEEPRE